MHDESPKQPVTHSTNDQVVFWGCFIALIATSFAFISRMYLCDVRFGADFGIDKVTIGALKGAGVWPFAISIILFSLIIDRIGYRVAMFFSFVCYVIYLSMAFMAYGKIQGVSPENLAAAQKEGYSLLYWGSIILGLGNGTVEAFINPVVATMFNKEKTKWLNILHAGWPGGLVIGGIITIFMGNIAKTGDWRMVLAIIAVPAIIYLLMLATAKFPQSERESAGVSYREMLGEFGAFGALIGFGLIFMQLAEVIPAKVFSSESAQVIAAAETEVKKIEEADRVKPDMYAVDKIGVEKTKIRDAQIVVNNAKWFFMLACTVIITSVFGLYTQSLGRGIMAFLIIIMMPLAVTEIGTDGWITGLMEEPMKAAGQDAGWVLVYTSAIMMVLRFFAGPIVHKTSPIGLLTISAVLAIAGLFALSRCGNAGLGAIFAAATLYGFGKTFFWPTMLGVTAEQCPKGGALTLNAISGIGMIAVGVLGFPFIGYLQESTASTQLTATSETVAMQVLNDKEYMGQPYKAIDPGKVETLTAEDEKSAVEEANKAGQFDALAKMAAFPTFMLACYVALFLYFKSKGGYKAEVLTGHGAEDEKFTGGVEGPADA